MEAAQPALFAEEALPRYIPDAQGARDRLQSMVDKMHAAASWPWKASTVAHYRETLWPSLLSKLPEQEGARLGSEIETEAARLDAVA